MKKIIAAALSILVGAFGYTIVDSAIEDRVSTLESEVVELREEVSEYHRYDNEQSTDKSQLTTSNGHVSPYMLKVGDYLVESPQSRHIFKVRRFSDGRVTCYLPNNGYYTRPYFQTVVYQDGLALLNESHMQTNSYSALYESTKNNDYDEFYLYITESSGQISNIETSISYMVKEDENYSKISLPIEENVTTVLITCKGYTDPVLAGRKIRFYYSAETFSEQYVTNTINDDGTFEYVAKYSIRYVPYSNNPYGFGLVYVD